MNIKIKKEELNENLMKTLGGGGLLLRIPRKRRKRHWRQRHFRRLRRRKGCRIPLRHQNKRKGKLAGDSRGHSDIRNRRDFRPSRIQKSRDRRNVIYRMWKGNFGRRIFHTLDGNEKLQKYYAFLHRNDGYDFQKRAALQEKRKIIQKRW